MTTLERWYAWFLWFAWTGLLLTALVVANVVLLKRVAWMIRCEVLVWKAEGLTLDAAYPKENGHE